MNIIASFSAETASKKGFFHVQAIDIHPQFSSRLLNMIFRMSSFEMNFFTAYEECLRDKEEKIKELTLSISSVIYEIMQLLTLDFGSIKMDKKTKLHDWFSRIKQTLESLDHSNKQNGEFVIQIKRKIIQVGEMMDLSRLALAQHLQKLHSNLDTLAALYNLSEEEKRRMQRSAEPSYLWPVLDDWTPRIQCQVLDSSDAQTVRTLFFKLSLSINVLCEQLIGQAYSFHLERHLRVILQSIPHKLFSLLKNTLSPLLQQPWEHDVDKRYMKMMADFDDNFRLAETTCTISNLSLGVSRMALKRVGFLSVNPKELLEEGIRRELVSELPLLLSVSEALHSLEGSRKSLI
ncbi:hypothetical protein DICVIV_12637 [Dictyocaulus viviparus]|uniref:Uncharacterized protein n=1 Tax=Dictyocaulus viviparus TaxID=29172 RepID=A0A0D8XC99_DICVI|nr:hypothetical protein DICVIV_12637 [Dictyocaulus viviparus]